MISQLVQLHEQYSQSYEAKTTEEWYAHLMEVIHTGDYYVELSEDCTQIIGYVEYSLTDDGIMYIKNMICTEPRTLWKLWHRLQVLPYTRYYFHWHRKDKWLHRKRGRHDAVLATRIH